MSTLEACEFDCRRLLCEAIRETMGSQEKLTEEQGMISSSSDILLQIWSTLESQTNSAVDWFKKCSPSSDLSILQSDYEPLEASETIIPIEQYSELESEVDVGPPEEAWKPLRVKLVMVQQSPLDL